jgi:multidrug efflux system membrane fusion protein
MKEFTPSQLEAIKMSPAQDQTRGRTGRGTLVAAAIAGIAIGAAASATLVSHGAGGAAAITASAPQPNAAVQVGVATVERREAPVWSAFSGRLEAVGRVAIRPRVQGPILQAHFREGSLVKQGDLLFTIDPAPYQAEVDRLAAQVAAATARLALAGRQQARGLQLGASADLARSDVDQRINEYRAAQANLQGSIAALRTAQLNLDYTQVRAPIAGRVGKIEVTAGNLVDAGATAPVLTTLVSVDPIYASFDADEKSVADAIASLPPGGDLSTRMAQVPVEMGTLATDGTPFRGRLELLDNVVDPASGTVRVRAVFDNADGHLIPGQFARLRLGRAAPVAQIAIDERAIGIDQDRRFVMLVGPGNKATIRQVSLGASDAGRRVVTTGLNPGDRVIVDGLQHVRPGAVVSPRPAVRADNSGGVGDAAL